MTAERWRMVERLYHAALEKRDARDRAVFLDSACGADAALRADVESLLAHDPDASSFMEVPAVAHLVADVPAPPRIGTRLGPYQLAALIGVGGMGEVYKASDTRLGRDVAIKVLPAFWSSDPDRRARLEREARAIAAVTHPHICALYDVGRDGDGEYLVLEYVEGETLAERLRRGALPLDEALRVAGQMASALAAAHARGIVHRDLKPANVVLTRDGGAKLLDFGLAKLGGPSAASSVTQPTAAASLTAVGTILGTLQYTSPEQVEGQEADARSDIFAFGAVLHEMISGAKAFEGKTQASLIAAILEREVPPLPQLRPETPPALARLVRTCLAKDPAQRWQSAADLERELAWVREDLGSSAIVQPARPLRRNLQLRVAWSIAMLATTLAIAAVAWRGRTADTAGKEPMHFSLGIATGTIGSPAFPTISPDGRLVVFVETHQGKPDATRMWLHEISTGEGHPIEGTIRASFPFWSPDSRSVGFFAARTLKRLDVKTGSIQTLTEAPAGRGGTWGPDGTIVFAPDISGPLMRISAEGGPVTPVTRLGTADRGHYLPSFLPDGRHFVFTRIRNTAAYALAVGSLDSQTDTDIVSARELATQGAIAAGKLLYIREGALVATDFDVATLMPHGEGVPVVPRVADGGLGNPGFSVSSSGVIVYRSIEEETAQLTLWSRDGTRIRDFGEPADYIEPRVSPDGRKVAVSRVDPALDVSSIWMLDPQRGLLAALTTDGVESIADAWSPDSKRLLYEREGAKGGNVIHAIEVENGRDETLIGPGNSKIAFAWLPDGSVLYATTEPPAGEVRLWCLARGAKEPGERIETAVHPWEVRLSPDGRWLAYTSPASGHSEVYVQGFPQGTRHQITVGGGRSAEWRRDGRELYYLTDDATTLNAAPVRTTPRLEIGAARALFKISPGSQYAPAPDGGSFYVALHQAPARPQQLMVLVNGLRQ